MQLFRILIALAVIPLFAQDPDPAKKPPTIEAKPTAPRASPTDYISQGKAATVTVMAISHGLWRGRHSLLAIRGVALTSR